MRCDTCKHWGYVVSEDENVRQCEAVSPWWERGTYQKINGQVVLVPDGPNVKAWANDGSSYAASLYTKADFFCAHYEAKK